MKSKLKIIIPVVLLVLGGVYKFVLSKPEPVHAKVHGQVYVLPKEFIVNLADGRFAKLTVGMVVAPEQALAAEGGHGAAAAPPEGFGTLAQEALVREIVTDHLTESKAEDLTEAKRRTKLKRKIAKAIHHDTDVLAERVVFTDVAVQ